MTEQEQINFVADKLRTLIRVSVAWEGHFDDEKKMDHILADAHCGLDFTFKEIYHSLYGNGVNVSAKMANIKKEVKEINDQILEKSIAIYVVAHEHGKLVSDFNDRYLEQAARGLSFQLGEKRLLVAPLNWLPTIFK